jgi:type III pantothenate kinase
MPLDIDNEDEVGVDRVCSAAAAYERVNGACAVASFGTAMTVDCVSSEGHFLGGAILPGFDLSYAALNDGTAQLPRIAVGPPAGVFGRNTHDAILNGVAFGAVGALREIVERFATELREWPQLVVTGGNGALIAELADFVDSVVPDLCLMGIALAHRKAAGRR